MLLYMSHNNLHNTYEAENVMYSFEQMRKRGYGEVKQLAQGNSISNQWMLIQYDLNIGHLNSCLYIDTIR